MSIEAQIIDGLNTAYFFAKHYSSVIGPYAAMFVGTHIGSSIANSSRTGTEFGQEILHSRNLGLAAVVTTGYAAGKHYHEASEFVKQANMYLGAIAAGGVGGGCAGALLGGIKSRFTKASGKARKYAIGLGVTGAAAVPLALCAVQQLQNYLR